MENFQEKLNEYAKLALKVGINVQEGQPLVINAPIEGLEFVRLLAKNAYELGVTDVHINWSDEELTKLKYENAPIDVFENYPQWKVDSRVDYAEQGAGFISISSADPNLLKDIDSDKIAASNKSASTALKEFQKYTMNDINPWLVVSIATKSWAKAVFEDLDEDEAVERLWEEIFKATRMDREDPIKAWEDHKENLKSKIKYLTEKNIEELHFTSSNGTDLKVELPKGHIWAGGGAVTQDGIDFTPNMPTDEVYTLPDKYGVNGTVYSTKPLNYGGQLVDEFKLVFKDGKVVDYDAKTGKNVLKDIFEIDEGANHLGEVALVPYDSPISRSNVIFLNTIYDENASCHFALGKAYPTNMECGADMNDEELDAHGVNDSLVHIDFMMGTKDTSVIGTTRNGEKVEIFKDGNWAF
ncbi:MAG TPA: aminopeptidase [Tissierellaceae bacterium]|nr:aminopeptidase [Tissierellaceae bacterium]